MFPAPKRKTHRRTFVRPTVGWIKALGLKLQGQQSSTRRHKTTATTTHRAGMEATAHELHPRVGEMDKKVK
jgi:hypothetical protein